MLPLTLTTIFSLFLLAVLGTIYPGTKCLGLTRVLKSDALWEGFLLVDHL